MSGDGGYLGCPYEVVETLKRINDRLNAEVAEHVNDSQELVMLNNFARESNEYVFKRCLEERISDIASWRWVLDDLNKRLGEAIETLRYEHNALVVVVERIQDELKEYNRGASQPGVLTPMTDGVEEALMQERNFLVEQKKKFENLITMLETQINSLSKTKKNIESDLCSKQQAITVEEGCARINLRSLPLGDNKKKLKKKESPVDLWAQRCETLKRSGLQALCNAVITRQQVRGARIHLSIATQSYAIRVDSALRRRLHSNKVKLQDLYWQKDEIVRDYKTLGEELTSTEQNILETMEQERVVGARLADRSCRPVGELTRDHVDKNLKDEKGRLRNFLKQLRTNHRSITALQNHLTDCITRIDCCLEDIMKVIRIDEERIVQRLGEEPSAVPQSYETCVDVGKINLIPVNINQPLDSIVEENEDDDYPFDF